MDHVPLTVQVRVNSCTGTPLSSLLDAGASLSIIDAALLERLGGTPTGDGMVVHGLGQSRTLGFATVTFFIEGRDPRDRQIFLECTHDLHVLPSFAPGLCLGRDFIDGHDLSITPARGRANVGRYTFAVHEHLPAPYSKDVELQVAEDVSIPPDTQVWVPVRATDLAPGVDYTVHPRLMVTADENVRLAGPVGLLRHHKRRHIFLGNFGTAAFALERGTPVADALAVHVGDAFQLSGQAYTLSPSSTDPLRRVDATNAPLEVSADSSPAEPLDAFEPDVATGWNPGHDAATTIVDEHFRVSIDHAGRPDAAIVETLRRHHAAFALDGRPGLVKDAEMAIELRLDAVLRPEAPRRVGPDKRAAIDKALDQLLDWDVVEASESSVSFPVHMVRQYGKWRFCVDYRNLNDATVPDRYPLPTVDSVFQTLCGKSIFFSLDAIRGYHQLLVRESDRWKTAFTCHRGLFQYHTVPFGLRNAPAIFQRLMDRLLGSLRWQHAVVYIDDIVVATRTMDGHVRALDTILTSAEAMGLRFSPSKCTFGVGSLVLLGRKVSGAGVAVWSDRAAAVRDLAKPTTLRELYHVLGLFGYYRAFVPHFARVAEPLTRLTRGWRYQQSDGKYRLVNTEGESASADRVPIVWTEEQQRSFDSLKAAISSPPVLAHPDPDRPYILYVDACKDGFGVALHQIHDQEEPVSLREPAEAALNHLSLPQLPHDVARERWAAWLRADKYFAPLLRDAAQRADDPAAETAWVVTDGVLVRRADGKVALPEAAVPDVMRAVHDRGGHFGFFKTLLAVRRDFWRPSQSTFVRAWVGHCAVCQRTKVSKKTGELRIDDDPRLPFECLSLNLVHGLPRTRSGNDAALVILDPFSRMVLIEPCAREITAGGVAAIISNRVLRYGRRPRRIVSDSEIRLTGSTMTAFAASLHADLTPSPPYHQQANAVERAIQTIQQVLQTMSLDSRAHWDVRHAPAVELAMNSTPSVVTGERPFDLVFIHHPSAAHAVFDAEEHLGVSSFEERLAAAAERLHEAREHILEQRRVQKRRYDRRRAPLQPLQVGDSVFLRLDDRPVAGSARDKLDPRKLGPFPVDEVLSDHRVRLRLPDHVAFDPVVSVEQLDRVPPSPDPFAAERVPAPSSSSSAAPDAGSPPMVAVDAPPVPRARRPPTALRDFTLGTIVGAAADTLRAALAEPIRRPRHLRLGDRSLVLVEQPVAFLSRLTTATEQRMVAAELELCCVAWAYARLAHLLEGAAVTIVTDHLPMAAMLTSTAGVPYGPTISRCRALLLPHLPNIRFVHRPGSTHSNVDALSRLPADPRRSASVGGHVLDDGQV